MANVLPPDLDGNTFLHHAARSGNVALIKSLLSDGYDINARNKGGLTPLDVADKYNQNEAVLELIRHQAKQGSGLS